MITLQPFRINHSRVIRVIRLMLIHQRHSLSDLQDGKIVPNNLKNNAFALCQAIHYGKSFNHGDKLDY